MSPSGLNWSRGSRSDSAARAYSRQKLSGGILKVPKTPAESLVLYIRLHKLKTDFLRRQEERQ